ncbi:GEM-interacting protein isoform X2 [Alligator mississippiensis]|uniref:GEM-interacting protein isoform X2 n=1 Tax=Alligator mississippiensis TaxID=8496 RepID=UPI00090703CD|nr:GEM-interacting protein isoform X2 [Alligator mississippiensis]
MPGSHGSRRGVRPGGYSRRSPGFPFLLTALLSQEPGAASDTLDLPRFLVEACEALQPHLGTPGLFRTAGSVARIRALKARVAGGEPCLGLAAPCDVAALLKRFLRELPEPLVPPALQEPLCQAQREPDPDRAPLTLLLTGLLPPAHACALRYLCCFLRRVAARCDENKMDAANLAVIFAPTLFPGPSWGLRLQLQAAAVQTLIQEAPSIGCAPQALLDELLAPELGDASVAETTPRPRCDGGPAPALPPKRKAWGAPPGCGKWWPAADEAGDPFEEPLGAEPAPEPRSLAWGPRQEAPNGMYQPAPIAPWDTWVPEPSSWSQMKRMVAEALCPPCGPSGDLPPEDRAALLHRRLRRSLSWPEDSRCPVAPPLPSPSQVPEVGPCPSGCLCSSWRGRRSCSHERPQGAGARPRCVRGVLRACGRLLAWRRGRKPWAPPSWTGMRGAVPVTMQGSCMFPV